MKQDQLNQDVHRAKLREDLRSRELRKAEEQSMLSSELGEQIRSSNLAKKLDLLQTKIIWALTRLNTPLLWLLSTLNLKNKHTQNL